MFIFLITVLVLVNFVGNTATLWVLGLILMGMVYRNWDNMAIMTNALTKGVK